MVAKLGRDCRFVFSSTHRPSSLDERPGVETDEDVDKPSKLLIAGSFRPEPEVLSSRLELVGTQDTPDCFGRNDLDQPICLELTDQFRSAAYFD